MSDATKKVTVELSADCVEMLEALVGDSHADVESVLRYLAYSAADGLRRPGAWERGWVEQAFSGDFEAKLEQDPDCEWHQRPRKLAGCAKHPGASAIPCEECAERKCCEDCALDQEVLCLILCDDCGHFPGDPDSCEDLDRHDFMHLEAERLMQVDKGEIEAPIEGVCIVCGWEHDPEPAPEMEASPS